MIRLLLALSLNQAEQFLSLFCDFCLTVHFLASWSEKPIESEDVQKAAKFAVENFNTKAKGKMLFKMVSIKSAKSKVGLIILRTN